MKRQNKTILALSLLATMSLSAGVVGLAKGVVTASADKTYATAKTTTAFTFEDGASIRLTGQGIRFTATLDESLYTVNEEVVSLANGIDEIGMIIVPAQALANVGGYDVFEYLKGEFNKDAEKISVAFENEKIVQNEDGDYCIKGAIVELITNNYNYDYQAIAYYKNADGYYYSAKSDTRSLADVAYSALGDTTQTWSDTAKTTFKNILKNSYSNAVGENATTSVVVGETLDLSSFVNVEDKTGYAYALVSENGVATLTDSTLTAIEKGTATVKVTFNGEELLTISVNANYKQIAVETEVDAGLDLATAINGTVASVTLNEEEVSHTNGVVALEKTDAGKEPKAYIVTDSEGNKYQVNATIWSLFIDSAEDLMKANTYTWNEQYTANAQGAKNYKVWGYFKLTNNINMSSNTWKREYAIATEVLTTYADGGFLGVFDGNNKTIDGFTTVAHEKAGLISYTGETAEVKNLTFTNAQQKSYSTSAILVHSACGGAFENIVIQVKAVPLGWDMANAGGVMFGTVYYNINKPVTLKNVTIINNGTTSYGSGANDKSTALGYMAISAPTKLILDSVTIIGFNDYLMSAENAYFIGEKSVLSKDKSTTDKSKSIYDFATIQGNGLKVYSDKDEYLAKAIALPAQEIELDDTKDYTVTVDFAKMVKGEIRNVTIDNVAIVGTSKTFGKADASHSAKVCLIEMNDGSLYKVNITVWSMLIANAEDLMKANAYGYLDGGAYYGYFKMTGDADLTGKTWQTVNMIDYGSTSSGKANGFQGVFDGNNKTITGLTISVNNTGLFNATGTNAVIKNLTITNANFTNTGRAGILVHYGNGGSIDNVSVQVSSMYQTSHFDNNKGLLFGLINAYGSAITVSNVTLTNTNPSTTYGQDKKDMCSAIGRLTARANTILTLNGVTISGFGNYILAVEENKASVVGANCVIIIGHDTDNVVDADKDGIVDEGHLNTTSGLKDYVVIGTNAVTIDGVKVTE